MISARDTSGGEYKTIICRVKMAVFDMTCKNTVGKLHFTALDHLMKNQMTL